MNRIYTLCVASLMLTVVSCKKSGVKENTNPEPEKETFPKIEIDVSGPVGKINKPVHQGNGEYNFLGYGYDITGKYADSSAVREMAIDVVAYSKDHSGRIINWQSLETNSGYMTAAIHAEELAAKISQRTTATAGTKSFRQSITSFFPENTALTTKYVYGDFMRVIQYKDLRFNWLPSQIEPYLTPAFKNDIQALSAAGIVKKYGTHILKEIYLGAKIHGIYQAISSSSNRSRIAEAGAEIAFKAVLGYIHSIDPGFTTADYKNILSAKIIYEVVGGDLAALKENRSATPVKVEFLDWVKTVNKEGAMFIDIKPNGLLPVYDLISDPVKRSAVQQYVETYIKEQEIKLIN